MSNRVRVETRVFPHVRDRWTAAAEREGLSLAAWVTQAANESADESEASERRKEAAEVERIKRLASQQISRPRKERKWHEHRTLTVTRRPL